jgi:sporulation protein YlmC with PRC-barrel domain
MQRRRSTGAGLLSLAVYGLIGYAGFQAYTHFKGGNGEGEAVMAAQAPTAGSQVMHNIDQRYETQIAAIPDDGISRSLNDFIGLDVFGDDKSFLGSIDDVYIDTRSGKINFISVVQESSSFREGEEDKYIYPISSFAKIDALQAAILEKDAKIAPSQEEYAKSLELSKIIDVDVINENDQRIGSVKNISIDRDFNIGNYVVQGSVIDATSGTNIILLPYQHAMITPRTVGLSLKVQANKHKAPVKETL